MEQAITSGGAVAARPREIIALQVLVAIFLGLRLYYDLGADLLGDEAYYWMWGQHLGWSYFDHPPLHAWLLRLVAILAGWHPLSVRLLTWLTLGGVLAIFAAWAPRLAPGAPRLWFWRTAAIYLSSPLFFGMTMIAYNDHLLVALSLLALFCFVRFTDRLEDGQPGVIRWLYFAAIALGLATLSKYNGAFVGVGFAIAFLLRPKLRASLVTPHPWLAASLALAMQASVIFWNLTTGLASFRYHLDDRWSGVQHFDLLHPVNFLVLSVVLWSPFLLWPLFRLVTSKASFAFEARAKTVALATLAVSTLSLLAISFVLDAYFYWNIVAFVGVMPLLTRFMTNPFLRWGHFTFGLIVAAAVTFNFAAAPVVTLFGRTDRGSSINYGWGEVAAHVEAAAAASPADLIAATRYSTTSQLGFALETSAVVKLSPEHSQYDYWQAEGALAGKSALILVDEPDTSPVIAYLTAHFATLSQVDAFPIIRGGQTIYDWRILRAEGFVP